MRELTVHAGVDGIRWDAEVFTVKLDDSFAVNLSFKRVPRAPVPFFWFRNRRCGHNQTRVAGCADCPSVNEIGYTGVTVEWLTAELERELPGLDVFEASLLAIEIQNFAKTLKSAYEAEVKLQATREKRDEAAAALAESLSGREVGL